MLNANFRRNTDLLGTGNKTTHRDCQATILHKMQPVSSRSRANFHSQIQASLKRSPVTALAQSLSCFHLTNAPTLTVLHKYQVISPKSTQF